MNITDLIKKDVDNFKDGVSKFRASPIRYLGKYFIENFWTFVSFYLLIVLIFYQLNFRAEVEEFERVFTFNKCYGNFNQPLNSISLNSSLENDNNLNLTGFINDVP